MATPENELPPELIGLEDYADIDTPVTAPEEKFVFKGMIPKIGPSFKGEKVPALLETGGIPGVLYAQFPVTHMRRAQANNWQQVLGKSGQPLPIYAIDGPSGRVDCVLLAKGRAIPGTARTSQKCVCRVHKEIKRITGLGGNGDPSGTLTDTPDGDPIAIGTQDAGVEARIDAQIAQNSSPKKSGKSKS